MRFTDTPLPGVILVESDVFEDERGLFVSAWMTDEFKSHGLDVTIEQVSLVTNHRRGTIRGLHYQSAPFEEAKLIRVVRGAVFDVAVDLRPESPTYLRWVGTELSAANRRMQYIPRGFAHGYQTLTDDAELFYFVSARYSPPHQQGLRWNDPAVGVEWPLGFPTRISGRDASFPDFQAASRR